MTPPQATRPRRDRPYGTNACARDWCQSHAGEAPVEKIAMYLDGFHVAKDDPNMQMEAHHYCNQVNDEFAQWSFNRDGEANPDMVRTRDLRMDLDSAEARQDRQHFVELARPQAGVDALAGFSSSPTPIPGVTDKDDAPSRPVPTCAMNDAPPETSARR